MHMGHTVILNKMQRHRSLLLHMAMLMHTFNIV
jgi:hypothetical protein